MRNLKYVIGFAASGMFGAVVSLALFYHLAGEFENEYLSKIEQDKSSLLVKDSEEVRDYRAAKPAAPSPVPFSGTDLTTAAENTVNGVVHVKTIVEGEEYYEINPFHFFFGRPDPTPRKRPDRAGSGSGVVIGSDGYIVTNNHVIREAKSIEVVTNNNKSYKAEIVGKDPSTDIALLKIEAEGLSTVSFGDSDKIKLGEWVLAVGNPLNLNSTVTAGIISAKGRNINILASESDEDTAPIESFIQTDAAVNPGNSGGALVNEKGELIGINTAIKSPTGVFAGYSFAIPSNIVQKVVADLKEFGIVQRAYIGVSIRNIDSELAEEQKLSNTRGVYVADIVENGAAKEAGIKEGDVIVSVDGSEVSTSAELQERVGRHRPGDEIPVEYYRKGELNKTTVVLRNKMGSTEIVERTKIESKKMLGAEFQDPDQSLMRRLRIRNGVQVKELNNGKFKEAGVKKGFIIVRIDKKEVRNFEEMYSMINSKSGGILIEGVYPNGVRAYYGVGL